METDIKILIEKFISQKRYAEERSETTMLNYHWVFKTVSELMPEIKTTNDLTLENIVVFLEKISTRKRIVGLKQVVGISTSTKRSYISKLHTFCEWLCENEYIRKNPITYKKLQRPRIVINGRKYLDLDEMNRIIVAITCNIKWGNNFIRFRNELIIVLAFTCGLRRAEILGITLYDINFDNKRVTIKGSTSKSKKTRYLHINSWCMTVLKKYLTERQKKNYKNPQLFVSDKIDGPFTTHGLKHMLKKVEDVSGVDFHMHNFRHTFAHTLKKNNTNVSAIQNLLGHGRLENTNAYLSNFPDDDLDKYIDDVTLQNLR